MGVIVVVLAGNGRNLYRIYVGLFVLKKLPVKLVLIIFRNRLVWPIFAVCTQIPRHHRSIIYFSHKKQYVLAILRRCCSLCFSSCQQYLYLRSFVKILHYVCGNILSYVLHLPQQFVDSVLEIEVLRSYLALLP